jgi:hypothetical protein
MDSEDPPPLSDQPIIVARPAETLLAPSAFRYGGLMASVSWLLALAVFALESGRIGRFQLISSLIAPILALPLASLIRSAFAAVISDKGISARDKRGKRAIAAWTEPHTVGLRRSMGIQHFEIMTPSLQRPLLIPAFKVKPTVLLAAIEQHAGADSAALLEYRRVVRSLEAQDG